MPRKKRTQGSGTEKMRKLSRTGGYTYYITIPKTYIDDLGWRERQLLVVKKRGQGLVIEDWDGR